MECGEKFLKNILKNKDKGMRIAILIPFKFEINNLKFKIEVRDCELFSVNLLSMVFK